MKTSTLCHYDSQDPAVAPSYLSIKLKLIFSATPVQSAGALNISCSRKSPQPHNPAPPCLSILGKQNQVGFT